MSDLKFKEAMNKRVETERQIRPRRCEAQQSRRKCVKKADIILYTVVWRVNWGKKNTCKNDENYWQHFDEPHFLCHSS